MSRVLDQVMSMFRPLTYPYPYPLTHSLTHPLTHSLTQLLSQDDLEDVPLMTVVEMKSLALYIYYIIVESSFDSELPTICMLWKYVYAMQYGLCTFAGFSRLLTKLPGNFGLLHSYLIIMHLCNMCK